MSEIKSLKAELIASIRRRDLSNLDNLWLQYVESNELDELFLNQCAQYLAEAGASAQLINLLELIIEEYSETKNYPGILETSRILAKRKLLPNSVQTPLVKALKKIYSSSPSLDKYILYSGIESTDNLQEAFTQLDEFLYCDVGQIFLHNTWGLGIVKDLDLTQQQVVLHLDKKGDHRFAFNGVRQFLKKIPDWQFLAIKKKDSQKIKSMLQDNPGELVKLITKSYDGKILVADLKKLLLDGLLTESDWSKWWTKTKGILKQDPYVDLSEGVKGEIQLRSEPKELHEEFLEKYEKSKSLEEKFELIKEFTRHQNLVSDVIGVANRMAGDLIDSFSRVTKTDVTRQLMYFYAYDVLHKSLKSELAEFPVTEKQLVLSVKNVNELIVSIPMTEYQFRIFDVWAQENPALWPEKALSLIAHSSPKLVEEILAKFIKSGMTKRIEPAVNQLLAVMETNPETYLWTVQQVLKGTWNHSVTSVSHYEVILELLELMETLQNRSPKTENEKKTKSNVLSKTRKMLEENNFRFVRDTILDISEEDAKHLRNSLRSCSALSEAFKTTVDLMIMKVRPDLEKQEKKTGGHLETRAEHYCTLQAYEKKKLEYQNLVSFEIPENSKDIAIARAHGDLRENAEYQSAKQKQRVLLKRVDELNGLLDRARIMDPAAIHGERVAFGTRIQVENLSTHQNEQYTILGIWEADVDKNIISYLSPLGSSFLGKMVGDEVNIELPQGKTLYKILKIVNALL